MSSNHFTIYLHENGKQYAMSDTTRLYKYPSFDFIRSAEHYTNVWMYNRWKEIKNGKIIGTYDRDTKVFTEKGENACMPPSSSQ